MSPERIAELRNKTIDLSDIPEVTPEQAKEFYPRNLRKAFQMIYNLFDKENLLWLEQNGASNKTTINAALEEIRKGSFHLLRHK
ncbi:MAG: hypothetical protein MR424_10770 [Treponema sp.]|nr:hypothetical protein [Treponema sp.]